MAERGKIVSDSARRWVTGVMPTAEYYAEVYRRERERVEREQPASRRLKRSRGRTTQASSVSI